MWVMLLALLLFTPVAAFGQSITINWDHPGGADSFKIYRAQGSAAFAVIGTAPGSARTYTDTGPLTVGQSYSYKVTAMYGSTETAATNTITQTVQAPAPTVPAQPSGVTVTEQTKGATGVTYSLSWTLSSGASTYPWRTAFNDGSGEQKASAANSPTTFTMPYHASNTAQGAFACVTASNSAGTSAEGCAGYTVPVKPPTQQYQLTVQTSGTGQGTTTGEGLYPAGSTATATATAAAGSTFAGWSGACSGSGTCSVVMDAAKTATAVFNATAPSGPPAPAVASGTRNCEVTLSAKAPDTTTGWTAQFRMDGGVSFAKAVTSPNTSGDYKRTNSNIQPGTHLYYTEWLKGGVVSKTSQKTTVACP